MIKQNILVSGSTGFIGKYFIEHFRQFYTFSAPKIRIDNIDAISLQGADAVVHLAGMAHQMKKIDDSEYFTANFELTRQLATLAKKNKVRQFIYFSTTKVFGEGEKEMYDAGSDCQPTDAYGKSKLDAEIFLRSIEDDEFTVTIIRPPLVYGPGVKGNMINLIKLSAKNSYLPFGSIDNKRSMVFVGNLCALIHHCLQHELTGTLLAGDNELISTTRLLTTIKQSLGLKPKLIRIPLFGRRMIRMLFPGLYIRLFGSFVINSKRSNKDINFNPPFTFEEGIRETINWYKEK